MGSELLRRVRWRNVGRACGVVLVVAAVVAWPRLNSSAPRVPDPAGRPLVAPTARPRRPITPPRTERQRATADPTGRRRRVRRRHEVVTPARNAAKERDEMEPADERDGVAEPAQPDDVVVAPTVVPPAPTPSTEPDPDPAQQEFGFEG
jgi:hypothetical protein